MSQVKLSFPNGEELLVPTDIIKMFKTFADMLEDTGIDINSPIQIENLTLADFQELAEYAKKISEEINTPGTHKIQTDIAKINGINDQEKIICDGIFMNAGSLDREKFTRIINFADYANFPLMRTIFVKYIALKIATAGDFNNIMRLMQVTAAQIRSQAKNAADFLGIDEEECNSHLNEILN